jgi:YgiT-type zinc finger domain-containing protein
MKKHPESTKSRTCKSCKSAMIETRVEHPYWHDNTLIAVINDVPSWVCQLCGNRLFDPSVEMTLRQLVQDYIKLGKTFPIPTTPYRVLRPILN